MLRIMIVQLASDVLMYSVKGYASIETVIFLSVIIVCDLQCCDNSRREC